MSALWAERPGDAGAVEPGDAADVQDMDPERRRAWLAATTGRRRKVVLLDGQQREPARREGWREDAACAGSEVDLVELSDQVAGAPHAQALCASCPVLAWCAQDARRHVAHGLWAGVVLNTGRAAVELPRGVLVDPRAWLADQLAAGPTPRRELEQAGRPLGIGSRRLSAAADALGVDRSIPGRPWTLPARAEQRTPLAGHLEPGELEQRAEHPEPDEHEEQPEQQQPEPEEQHPEPGEHEEQPGEPEPPPGGRPRGQRRQPRRPTRARRRRAGRIRPPAPKHHLTEQEQRR